MFDFLRRHTVEEVLRQELCDVVCTRIAATARVAYWENQEVFLFGEITRLNSEINQLGRQALAVAASAAPFAADADAATAPTASVAAGTGYVDPERYMRHARGLAASGHL